MQVLEMPTKKQKLSVYLEPELKSRLEQFAKSQKRSVNNMIEFLIEECLDESEEKKTGDSNKC